MLGVLVYEILTTQTPFEGANLNQIRENVLNFQSHSLTFNEDLEVSQDLQDLLTRLLEPDPELRATFREIKVHPFFEGNWQRDIKERSNQIIKTNMEKEEN